MAIEFISILRDIRDVKYPQINAWYTQIGIWYNAIFPHATNIDTVATNIVNVNTTATNIANVNAVGADLLEPVSEIDTVATNVVSVNTVATNIADISTVANDIASVITTATNIANVNTVASNIANVNATGQNIANVNIVATDLQEPVSEINTVATNIGAIEDVAGWINTGIPTIGSSESVVFIGTIAALRLLTYAGQQIVSVTGYYTAADNIGVREYFWDALSVEADNGGTIIQVTGVVTGRWKMKIDSQLTDSMFGNILPEANLKWVQHIDTYNGFIQDNQNANRLYIMPKATSASGVGGVLKIFADPYYLNQTDYRDFGLYFSADQLAELGVNGDGVFWINSKSLGSYSNPDIACSFQDGAAVAWRASYDGTSIGVTFGKNTPVFVHTIASVKAEFHGDIAFLNSYGIRFGGGDSVADTIIKTDTSNNIQISVNGNAVVTIDTYGRLQQGIKNSKIYSLAYNASLTPSVENGSYQKVYLTGNATISSPINSVSGDEITLHLSSDTSNRIVTLSGYRATSATYTVTANKTSLIKFKSDGTSWFMQSLVENI